MTIKAFACRLVGQPTLRRRIKLGAFAALDQRIVLRYAMAGMNLAETNGYLAHHLKLAGRSDTLFSDDDVALVHQVSRGLPRAVNNLAIQALVAADRRRRRTSARADVTEVTTEDVAPAMVDRSITAALTPSRIRVATRSRSSVPRASSTTCAPSSASRTAVASPSPLLAPVTIAT
jgi:hypothetical protein